MSKGHGTETLRYALEKGTGAVCFLLGSVGDNTEHGDTGEQTEGFEYKSKGFRPPLGNRRDMRLGARE